MSDIERGLANLEVSIVHVMSDIERVLANLEVSIVHVMSDIEIRPPSCI